MCLLSVAAELMIEQMEKENLSQGELNVDDAPKICWTQTGLLSRIRSGITCAGSSTRCNPLISLLCAARPGSQVFPICTPPPPQCTHKHTLRGSRLAADERLGTRAWMCLQTQQRDQAATLNSAAFSPPLPLSSLKVLISIL